MTSGTFDAKIKSLEELEPILAESRGRGSLVVQCHGVFDLLHPGHIRHFEAARTQGDILVVTVTPIGMSTRARGGPSSTSGSAQSSSRPSPAWTSWR